MSEGKCVASGCQIRSPKQILLCEQSRNELYSLAQKNGVERPYYKLNRKLVCQCDSSRILLDSEVTMRNEHGDDRKLCKQSSELSAVYFSDLIINDMERFSKSKKPSLGGPIHVPGQATSISTLLTSTNLMPFFC